MTFICSRTLSLGLVSMAALFAAVTATPAIAYTPEQEQACTSDAFKLCSSEIPDVPRVTACMARNKARLSPACRAQFRAPAADSTRRAKRKPATPS